MYIKNELQEKKINESMQFKIVFKSIKYLRINKKNVRDLNHDNLKSLKKKIEQ